MSSTAAGALVKGALVRAIFGYLRREAAIAGLSGPGPFRHFHHEQKQREWTKVSSVQRRKSHSSSSGGGGGRELGETSTMHQEGGQIQEVPIAVFKAKEMRAVKEEEDGSDNEDGAPLELGDDTKNLTKSYIDLDPVEEAAFIEGFNNFNSPQEVIKILDTIPSQEVTPVVSVGILRKLFELENNFVFRNQGMPWTVSSDNSAMDTFARSAIVSRLIDTIITTEDNRVLLQALKVLNCEKPLSPESGSEYRQKVFDQVLVRVAKGKFSFSDVCDAVISLGNIQVTSGEAIKNNLIDKLWVGIFEKSEEIDAGNLPKLFHALPYFKKSQRLVINLAERKLLALWWKLDTGAVSSICSVFIKDKRVLDRRGWQQSNQFGEIMVSNRMLSALARGTSLNLHQVTEDQLLTIVRAFHSQNFCDEAFEKAINKYMKAKCVKISNPKLVSAILDYCKKFHVRSDTILDAAAEFLVLHKAENMSTVDVTSVVTTFGHLDFQPSNGVKFWQTVEAYLNDKFIQFCPKDIIEVLLACVYLMKFPLNFADRIFSPYFLDRVHTCEQDYTLLQKLRSKLKLLDISMTIECPNKYNGPMLPKDFTARSVFVDGRILRMGNWLEDVIREVLGVRSSVEKFVVLPNLPLSYFYIVDILVSNIRKMDADRFTHLKNRISSRLNSGQTPEDNDRSLTAILIHVPEHYTRDGRNLVGSEVTRIRHLTALGFNVAPLNYAKLSELKVHPVELREYLRESITQSGYLNS